jgi:hypothetical protein
VYQILPSTPEYAGGAFFYCDSGVYVNTRYVLPRSRTPRFAFFSVLPPDALSEAVANFYEEDPSPIARGRAEYRDCVEKNADDVAKCADLLKPQRSR